MVTNSMEDVLSFPKPQQERRLRPQPDQALKCPRCDSLNTKFCYYNNYSLSQPRYFCKGCRRYWTQGGTLRNVPVGGGCRKNKRSSSSSSSSSSSTSTSKRSQEQALVITTNSNNLNIPNFTPLSTTYDSNDLTFAFARLHNHHQPSKQFGLEDHDHHDTNSILGSFNSSHCDILASPNNQTTNMNTAPFIDALRSGLLETQNSGFQNFGYGSFGSNEEVGDQMEGVVLPNYNEVLMSSGTTTASTVTTTTKQEYLSCKGRNINGENINRGFWNFPWHNIGTGGGSGGVGVGFGDHQGSNTGGVENSGRESWNGLGPSWHGLINSPLM